MKKLRDIIELPEVRRKVLYAIGLCLLSVMMGILLAGFFTRLSMGGSKVVSPLILYKRPFAKNFVDKII